MNSLAPLIVPPPVDLAPRHQEPPVLNYQQCTICRRWVTLGKLRRLESMDGFVCSTPPCLEPRVKIYRALRG